MLRYGPAAVRRIFDASSECGSGQYQRADKTPPSGCSKTRSMRPRSRRCGRRPLRTHEEVPVSPPRKVEGARLFSGSSLQGAVDRVFYDWWADNDHALSLGLPEDVLELRERLNAAFAKASSCSLVAPREARNAPIAVSKSMT
jgi:hypothetical protein